MKVLKNHAASAQRGIQDLLPSISLSVFEMAQDSAEGLHSSMRCTPLVLGCHFKLFQLCPIFVLNAFGLCQ